VLGAVRQQGRHLGRRRHLVDRLGVVRFLGVEQQQFVRSMVDEFRAREKVRVAGDHHAVDDEEARRPVVGMEPPAPPRVVAEQHVGPEASDPGRHLVCRRTVGVEFAVDPAEEGHLAGRSQPLGGGALLVAPGG
ncbi:uncharacterized protein METZ01_LOCUS180177, partial [marine metagenome]